jgi:hypothetical protein
LALKKANSNLIVVSEITSEIVFAQAAASGCGLALKAHHSVADALSDFSDDSILLVESTHADKILNRRLPQNRVYLLMLGTDFKSLSPYFGAMPFGSFILRKFAENAASDGAMFARILNVNFTKNLGVLGLKFPLEAIESLTLLKAAQKRAAATAATYFLMECGFNEQLSATIGMAVDEVLMNAILDAPIDTDATDASEFVRMEIALDEDLLGITVSDPHGTLKRQDLLDHLNRSFIGDLGEVRGDESKSGAGLGLTQILKTGGSLLFDVIPGKMSAVTLVFRKTRSNRESKKQMQFLATFDREN